MVLDGDVRPIEGAFLIKLVKKLPSSEDLGDFGPLVPQILVRLDEFELFLITPLLPVQIWVEDIYPSTFRLKFKWCKIDKYLSL